MTLGVAALLLLSPLAATPAGPGELLAIKVGKAETVSHGTLEHAVILVEDGKIVTIGEDLPIERGIPVLDKDPEWVVMPGLVNCYSRMGLDGRGGGDSRPGQRASGELHPGQRVYEDLLDAGVTTLGLYPPGNGIPGRAVAVRTKGDTAEAVTLRDDVYLKILLRSTSGSKKMLRDGFEEADKWIEKEQKAREKWEKEKEKFEKKKKSKKKDDEKKDDEKKDENGKNEEEKLEPYAEPEKDPKAEAFLQLRDGSLTALISISDAGDYLHLIDAIGDEEFQWDLRMPVARESNFFYIAQEIGGHGRRVVMEPTLSLHPNTMRQRNLPAELARAGAKLALVPRSDNLASHKDWLRATGEMVAAGLDRQAALRALTLEPAEVLGLGEQLGSLEAGKAANMIFLKADPFEPGSEIQAVMLDGRFVSGEVEL